LQQIRTDWPQTPRAGKPKNQRCATVTLDIVSGAISTARILRATVYIVTRSIELSEEAVLVLASLVGGPKHGYALINDVDEHAGKRPYEERLQHLQRYRPRLRALAAS
jgi:hypothetical protein